MHYRFGGVNYMLARQLLCSICITTLYRRNNGPNVPHALLRLAFTARWIPQAQGPPASDLRIEATQNSTKRFTACSIEQDLVKAILCFKYGNNIARSVCAYY